MRYALAIFLFASLTGSPVRADTKEPVILKQLQTKAQQGNAGQSQPNVTPAPGTSVKVRTPAELAAESDRDASVRYKWEEGGFHAESTGGYWPNKVYHNWVFNKEFTSLNTTQDGEAPASTLALIAHDNGSSKDVLPLITMSLAHKSKSAVFGFNSICGSVIAITFRCVGGEIDVEPTAGSTAGPGSAGLYINAFNVPIPGAAIQTGGIGGGSFSGGLNCDGLVQTGACVAAVGGARMGWLVNASTGIYSSSAFVTGTGVAMGFGWGTLGGGASPYTYGDSLNNFVVLLGNAGAFVIKDRTGANNIDFVQSPTSASARHTIAGVLSLTPFTFAGLNNADPKPVDGDIGIVTDALACLKGVLIKAGGATFCVVVYNSGWKGI